MTGSSRDEVRRAYDFSPMSSEASEKMKDLRAKFQTLALFVHDNVPAGRARSLALTDLQTAKMWAVQAVVDSEED